MGATNLQESSWEDILDSAPSKTLTEEQEQSIDELFSTPLYKRKKAKRVLKKAIATKSVDEILGGLGQPSEKGKVLEFKSLDKSPDELLGKGPRTFRNTDEKPMSTGKIIKLKTGYIPRKIQTVLHQCLKRFNVLVCHRRFGKTVLAVNHMIHRAMANPMRNPQYAYIAPTYKQAKRVAWQYFKDYTRFLPNVKCNSSELTIYIERPSRIDPVTGEKDADVIKIMLIGADDPDDIRGMYFDGVILDEYAQCDPMVWGEIIRQALGDRGKIAAEQGLYLDLANNAMEPWAIFIGTPKGQNHFYRRYHEALSSENFCRKFEREHDIEEEKIAWDDFEESNGIGIDTSEVELEGILASVSKAVVEQYSEWVEYKASNSWFTSIYKASETGILPLSELAEMRKDLAKEEIEQELECSFTAAIKGAYFGTLLNRAETNEQITTVLYDPRYPVDTFWDIGVGDKTTIWFRQKIGNRYHYINYYECRGKGLSHYISVLRAMENYDGSETEVDEGETIMGEGYRYGRHIWPHDGKVQEFGSGQTRQETARKAGLRVEIQPKQRVEDRINASRNRIKISFFDKNKCARGIECLYNYQKDYDSKLMVFKLKPKHDWSSHAADSFGYSSLDDRDTDFPEDRLKRKKQFADGEYDLHKHAA